MEYIVHCDSEIAQQYNLYNTIVYYYYFLFFGEPAQSLWA